MTLFQWIQRTFILLRVKSPESNYCFFFVVFMVRGTTRMELEELQWHVWANGPNKSCQQCTEQDRDSLSAWALSISWIIQIISRPQIKAAWIPGKFYNVSVTQNEISMSNELKWQPSKNTVTTCNLICAGCISMGGMSQKTRNFI